MPAPVDRPMIGHLHNPRTRRASRCPLEESPFAEDKQEDFLQEIFSLGRIPQDAVGDRPHQARVAPEEERQGAMIAVPKLFKKEFIGKTLDGP